MIVSNNVNKNLNIKDNTINIYNKENQNFGDGVNKVFWEKIIKNKIKYDKYKEHYITTGSIMCFVNDNSIIFGTGFISKNANLGGDKFICKNKNYVNNLKNIICVRGPLSRNKFLEYGYKCPENYGDPLILMPCIYNNIRLINDNIVGIIPHFDDRKNKNVTLLKNDLEQKNFKVVLIDIAVGDDYKKLIDKINSCNYIISSSLHGVIMGLVYKKKTIFIEFSKNVIGNGFKFNDFFESLNIKYDLKNDYNISILSNVINLDYNTLKKLGNKLISLIPFINQDRKNELTKIYDNFYLNK